MHFFVILLSLLIICIVAAYLFLYKPWINPKIGELWVYQPDDPFEEPIIYKIIDRKKRYVKMEVVKDVYPFKAGHITTRLLPAINGNIKKLGTPIN